MAPRAANVGSDESTLAGAHAAAPPQGQHHPAAQAPGRVPARAGAAAEEDEDVGDDEDDEMVSVRMYHQFLRESVRPGNSRRSEASAAAAHELPAAPPTQPVESTEGSTAASSFLPATPSSRSGATPSAEVEGEVDILDETPEVGEARAVPLVRAPQVRVVELRAEGQGQAGEEEDGEEVDGGERGGEIEGVHPARDTDNVGDEVLGNSDRKGKEDQAAEVLAAQAAAPDQGRNRRRFGRAEFTPDETCAVRRMGQVFSSEEIDSVQSSLQPPGPSEAAESPPNSPPPSLPALSETEATAVAEAPIIPSSGSPLASADTPRLPCRPSSEESTREPRC